MIAQLGQHRHCNAAHTTSGTRDQNFTIARLGAVFFNGHHAEHCGVACSANGHGLAHRESCRLCDQPVALDLGILGKPTRMGLAHAPASEHHGIALFE